MSDQITVIDKSYALEKVQSNDDNNSIERLIEEVVNLRIALKEMKDEIVEDLQEVTGQVIDHFKIAIAKQLGGDITIESEIDSESQSDSSQICSESEISENEAENNTQELAEDQTEKNIQNQPNSTVLVIEDEID